MFDAGSANFVVFDSTGMFVRQVRPPFGRGYPGRRLRAHPAGGVVSAAGDGQSLLEPGESEPATFQLNWYPLDGRAPIRIAEAWRADAGAAADPMSVADRRVGITALPALAPRLHFDVLPDGRVVLVDSTTYDIQVRDPNSAAREVFSRPIAPRSTTRRDREAEIARRRARRSVSSRGLRLDERSRERQLANLAFWPERAVVSALRVAPDGTIWVERPAEDGGPPSVDLLGPDGSYRGTARANGLRAPDALGPGGWMAFIEGEETDVPGVRLAWLRFGDSLTERPCAAPRKTEAVAIKHPTSNIQRPTFNAYPSPLRH